MHCHLARCAYIITFQKANAWICNRNLRHRNLKCSKLNHRRESDVDTDLGRINDNFEKLSKGSRAVKFILLAITCLVQSNALWEAYISPVGKKTTTRVAYVACKHFYDIIQKLLHSWTNWAEKKGDYIEKLYHFTLTIFVILNKN
jgi:hypothetical protein